MNDISRTLISKRTLTVLVVVLLSVVGTPLFTGCSKKGKNSTRETGSTDTIELLHVSFDIAREIGRRLNAGFIPWYKEKSGVDVTIEQSNAGSSRQARAVADGLPADVVSMNQYLDIDLIYERTKDNDEGALIPQDWQRNYPNNSSPASSTMAFVVRKGNPKNIKDWNDLVRDDVEIIAPNYRSTGNGRYSLLTAYAYGARKYNGVQNSDAEAYEFTKKVIKNTVVLAQGGRDATNIFVEREFGDVLLTFEAEVNLIVNDLGADKFDVVVPSYGVDAKIYVVVIDKNAKAKSEVNYAAAKAYWDFIYTDAGQEIVAQSFFRPINQTIATKYKNALPNIELFTVDEVYGGWGPAKEQLFADGGVVDRIYEELGKN